MVASVQEITVLLALVRSSQIERSEDLDEMDIIVLLTLLAEPPKSCQSDSVNVAIAVPLPRCVAHLQALLRTSIALTACICMKPQTVLCKH